MEKIKFATCEYCFPIWGALAIEMAKEAGFEGIEITDGGGYLQPHPLNNGYVEYERLGLDLRRDDSFPFMDPYVQNDYMEAADRFGIKFTGLKLHLLENQGFIKAPNESLQGRECLESIKNAVATAVNMNIPAIIMSARGLFGTFQHEYAYQKVEYASKVAAESGIEVYVSTDIQVQKQINRIDKANDNVKLEFNTIDPEICNVGNPADMLREIGKDRIGQIKLKDLIFDREGFLTKETSKNALIGTGDSKLIQCTKVIQEINYEGWIVSETPYYSVDINYKNNDYVAKAAMDVETLKKLFS